MWDNLSFYSSTNPSVHFLGTLIVSVDECGTIYHSNQLTVTVRHSINVLWLAQTCTTVVTCSFNRNSLKCH